MMGIGSLPQEICGAIFDLCIDDNWRCTGNLARTCKVFKTLIEDRDHKQKRAVDLLSLTKLFDQQVNHLSQDQIISDEEPLHPSITKITTSDIQKLMQQTKASRCLFEKGFLEFKEKLIDALCDVDNQDKLQAPPIGDWVDHILEDAAKRVKGDVFICPHFPYVVGRAGVSDHSYEGRRWGDYGTHGEPVASIKTWITSRLCRNWSEENHPVFGQSGIDAYLPGSLFYGKKEGDSIKFSFRGKIVKLFCRQRPYTYGDGVNGEKAFQFVLQNQLKATIYSSQGLRPAHNYHPLFFPDEQLLLMQELFFKYHYSIKEM